MHTSVGFVKLPRNIVSWRWYTDANVLRLYIHLMIKANFADADWKNETIKKGQVVTGRKKLAEELEMSENSVRGALEKLKASGDISIKSTNKYSVITLLKWDETAENSNFFTNNPPTNHHQSTNKPPQYNNKKNENNEKNYGARGRARKKYEENSSINWSLVEQLINA